MNALELRLRTVRMTIPALARRARLSVDTVDTVARVVAAPADASDDESAAVARLLGLRPDGRCLIPTRTFLKIAARKRADFPVGMVQGTMALEAQGLTGADREALRRKTVARLLADKRKLW